MDVSMRKPKARSPEPRRGCVMSSWSHSASHAQIFPSGPTSPGGPDPCKDAGGSFLASKWPVEMAVERGGSVFAAATGGEGNGRRKGWLLALKRTPASQELGVSGCSFPYGGPSASSP
uniref:Uncharacterized protein n=1 Tax=Macaca fascicularis TaxID=9541 RepID=Q9BH03_MACFA|nr:hypothetical protein [Macaca fascicularis]